MGIQGVCVCVCVMYTFFWYTFKGCKPFTLKFCKVRDIFFTFRKILLLYFVWPMGFFEK